MTVPVTTTAGVRYQTQHPVAKASCKKLKTVRLWLGHCPLCGWNTRSVIWYQAYHTIRYHMLYEHGGRL